MAWRVDEQVIRGEIDCRARGRVTGRIWFHGRENPVELDLEGGPWRDLAGHFLRFTNPAPVPGDTSSLVEKQTGAVGDITASRKVKVPDCPVPEMLRLAKAKLPFPWHWANSLYLEWFGAMNGRVVIESADYQLELESAATWEMSEDEEAAQRVENSAAMMRFLEELSPGVGDFSEEIDDDEPQSEAERKAQAEDDRMNLLLDRMTTRLDASERKDGGDFERIYEEERARMKRERGTKEKEQTPEEAARRAAWIEEMNAITREASADVEAEKWKDDGEPEPSHPLVERASDLAIRIHHELRDGGWMPEDGSDEHPLHEIIGASMSAAAKLAGAFGMGAHGNEWPPDALIAGNVIIRLKKARTYLTDALRAMDSADAENLADASWRLGTRKELEGISGETTRFIREAREVLG